MRTADIAFGQPDLGSIRESGRLRWIHLTSAGFTRYDTRRVPRPRRRARAHRHEQLDRLCRGLRGTRLRLHARAIAPAVRRRWQSHTANGTPEWLRLRGAAVSLRGQRAVILGYGAIAAHLVKLLAPFEMQITALRRTAARR